MHEVGSSPSKKLIRSIRCVEKPLTAHWGAILYARNQVHAINSKRCQVTQTESVYIEHGAHEIVRIHKPNILALDNITHRIVQYVHGVFVRKLSDTPHHVVFNKSLSIQDLSKIQYVPVENCAIDEPNVEDHAGVTVRDDKAIVAGINHRVRA